MDENQTTVTVDEVAPQTETAEATDEAEVSGENQPTTVDENGNADAETSESNEDAEQNGTDGVDSAPFLSVRFNHEDRELTQAEARSYAQKGMQAEPLMADLRYLAAQDGYKSVKEFLETLKKAAEDSRMDNIRGQLVDEDNEDLINAIYSAEVSKIKSAAGVIEADEQKAFAAEYENEHTRLADEFVALQKEFPELKEFKDVSKNVLMLAQKEKISLLDAQLRFNHAENKKIKKAEMSAAAAAETSTGSMESNENYASSSVLDALDRAFSD
jgi:hypothetical protein